MTFNKTEALRRADEHMTRGEITGAIAIHRMIVQADPYDLNTINALGELYVRAGRTKDAVDDFTRIADSYLNSGSGIKAAYLLRKALDLNPSNAPARMKLGEIYLREGMIEKAHDEFIRAGAVLVDEGQLTGALQANHRALTAKPGSSEARAAIAALQADAAASENGSLPRQPKPEPGGLGNSSELGSEPARPPSRPMETLSTADEESLIQQLSKAEMLVGYGEVDRALALLNEVVRNSPDNLDVHGKLKDIYLRNEMIKEAGQECLELARIHEARGESARANEYAMRAGRLAQSTGQLAAQPAVKASDGVAKLEAQSVAALGKTGESKSEVPESRIEAEPAAPEKPPVRISQPHQPETVDPKPVTREAGPQPVSMSPIVSQPKASPSPPAQTHKPFVERAPANLALRVGETLLATAPHSERKQYVAKPCVVSDSLPVPSTLGLMPAASSPVSGRRPKWFYVASIAMVGATALLLGAMKGASMYDAKLNRQYEELALSSPLSAKPSPPDLPSQDDLQPGAQAEVVTIDSHSPVETPSTADTEQQTRTGPPPLDPEPKGSSAVPNEPPRAAKPAAAAPPMVAVTDQRGGENYLPRGIPTGAPQTAAPLPSPPPSSPAPQRASAIIRGEAIKQVQPNYPTTARTARQEGIVSVEVNISESGDVVSARVVSGPAMLRRAAESAARQWKFRPSTRDGKPLMTVTTINFRFKL
jgi:TonB family protein